MSDVEAVGWLRGAIGRGRYFLLSTCAVVFLFAWTNVERKAPPLLSDMPAKAEGGFRPADEYPAASFDGASQVRRWASEGRSGDYLGSISLGPFSAPSILYFWVSGGPTHVGNETYAELASTHERLPLELHTEVGARWKLVSLEVPESWVGKPIELVAHVGSVESEGWVNLSEPVDGGDELQLLSAMASLSLNAFLLGVLWFAAARRLAAVSSVTPSWIPLLAAGLVAILGYLAFWAYFLDPLAGKLFSIGVFLFACVDVLSNRVPRSKLSRDAVVSPMLLILIGTLYVALLHFFPSNLDYCALANGRWVALSRDNLLPQAVSSALFKGQDLHWTMWGWQTSDRPPLQSGWMLLTWVFGAILGLDEQITGGTSALLFQLIWVFAVYGLLGSLGVSRGRSFAWIAVLSLCGFFIINSVFTWPKLSAGAFGCGAFGLWVFPERGSVSSTCIVLGGVLAALALLSHAGVAFSIMALTPWIVWRAVPVWRPWAKAFILFLLLILPWTAFQKFYAPPGNRLLKMHLAGQFVADSRATWQTIRESYSKLSWDQISHIRRANFQMQIPRDWSWLYDFSTAHAPDRRREEFFGLLRSVTWWLFGLLAFPVALVRRRSRVEWRLHLDLLLWSLAAVVLWCSILFLPKMAILHQGSFCVPIAAFVLLSAWLEFASSRAILVILVLQGATFATTWAVAGDQVRGRLNYFSVACAVLAGLGLVAVLARELRKESLASQSKQLA